jgi:hypothetical protein
VLSVANKVDECMLVWSIGGMIETGEKLKCGYVKIFHCSFINQKSHMDCPGN